MDTTETPAGTLLVQDIQVKSAIATATPQTTSKDVFDCDDDGRYPRRHGESRLGEEEFIGRLAALSACARVLALCRRSFEENLFARVISTASNVDCDAAFQALLKC